MLCVKFGWNCPIGSEEDENVKIKFTTTVTSTPMTTTTDNGHILIRKAHLCGLG